MFSIWGLSDMLETSEWVIKSLWLLEIIMH